MSASSMTSFVRNLFKQSDDYRSLTQRMIRDRYMQHANLSSLDDDQRSLLREIVQIMVAEMVQIEESLISNKEAVEIKIHSSKVEDESRQNANQQKQTKPCVDKKQGDSDTDEEGTREDEKEEEEVGREKKRKLESSEDSASNSERTFSAKKNKLKKKIVDSSTSESDDGSTKAKGIVTTMKKQQKTRSKTDSQKKDSDVSAAEPEDTNSDSEKDNSSKTKEASRQSTQLKTVARKRNLSELSYDQSLSDENHKPKKLKGAISKKRGSSELSDSQMSKDEETNPESDGSESARPQKRTKPKDSKMGTKTASGKRKLSNSSEAEPLSDEETKSDSCKKILDSDDSGDGELLRQRKSKSSLTSKASEDGDASTPGDLGTLRTKETGKSKNIKPVRKGMASSINDSSSDDEQALAVTKRKFQKSRSDSDEESLSRGKTSKKSIKAHDKDKKERKKSTVKKKPSKAPTHGDDKDENVKKLERVARACGILPVGKHYKLAFENCRDNKERSVKLKQMLRDAGMTGTFSMKSAETLKLKREAAELLSSNVILPEGRGRRRASNPLASFDKRRERGDSLSPPPPVKESFSRLKDIVDSEEDSD